MTSTASKRAYSEVDSFLEMLSEETRNKVPENIRNAFKQYKDSNYSVQLRCDAQSGNYQLTKEALKILAFLDYTYWCDDENEKKKLFDQYSENDKKQSEELQAKLDCLAGSIQEESNKIENDNKASVHESNQQIAVHTKPNFWSRLIHRIMNFFKKS